ncbi:MAG: KEOPS complex N(6)-L-threonylcarbamoyladenine synthase Kae1 [Crenarchaeota archaeon]|nr:KEOPS complex N(6)-L-threonylcarbamoyladenine synthase Kae1 [Thermoproteota archaeon]MCR8453469.1 KEOPS complex N(6)-L-threonylcarbamoyladenine synthase Kae1 [Thermoproteota archaeon]MCR8454886.1 KEOPS complex N(6)-L-threonylcarbamoyladenine synthase Kae1 [Thermoproteota archaeon]MCR8462772.1 KEOPS complex N(6)-L-threonylcarbamoyladenine synthase Kae1 [Thermoproteota archaeon]MCR8470533.1 KEOPS complex N(6)-L-threonylcarbamoyladenine synthase Kae1 [Thermoproteota archaeon]
MRYILGIESTSHTFGIGLVGLDTGEIIDISSTYTPKVGGIHPREAVEHHTKVAPQLLQKAMEYLKRRGGRLVAIGFSRGPGLGPCLRLGATLARALAAQLSLKLYGIHHAIAHIEIAKKITNSNDPLVVLVSGGHTTIASKEGSRYRVWGETLDISLGNLIDMFMRAAGYPSPAGPLCEKFAAETQEYVEIPYVVKGTDLSFSGMLSALKAKLNEGLDVRILCKSLQETAFAMLCEVVERALAHSEKAEILLCGGVANNKRLQEMLSLVAKEWNAKFAVSPRWNSDNGCMIAYTTMLYYLNGAKPLEIEESYVLPLWRMDSVDLPY